jgi:hypothetical protein
MRASDTYTESLFTMSKLEDFIPQSHPLRPIRKMVNEALTNLECFLTSMYAAQSQGELMEQTQYNLLYRWFIVH